MCVSSPPAPSAAPPRRTPLAVHTIRRVDGWTSGGGGAGVDGGGDDVTREAVGLAQSALAEPWLVIDSVPHSGLVGFGRPYSTTSRLCCSPHSNG